MNRRGFLGSVAPVAAGGVALAVMPTSVAAAAATTLVMRKPVTKIAPKRTGDMLTAQSWNELVDAVNELREAQ